VLKVKKISKSYHRKKALSECSFDLEPYQIMGIFGHNGCGKSTLFRIIMGILKADEGEIIVDHKILGYMPEQRSLLIDLSLRKQARFMAHLKGIHENECETRLLELSQLFNLRDMIDKPLKTLSKGNQQKAQLILSILHEPKILILDEPFNGLDHHSQKDLSHWIRSYAQKGNAVLISSHQLEHMNGLCDEILILDRGITMTQGHLKTIRENHQMYSVRVNADSNWKDLDQPYESLNAIESLIEYRFKSIQEAKKALNTFSKDKSVQSLHLEMVDLSELIHP
jgi:ABC-2 type transport system ATP-binding protein